jgi:hypothetical protein
MIYSLSYLSLLDALREESELGVPELGEPVLVPELGEPVLVPELGVLELGVSQLRVLHLQVVSQLRVLHLQVVSQLRVLHLQVVSHLGV